MSDFRRDYEWQLKFAPAIRNIVGPLLLQPAPFEIDANEACDMLVLNARDMRIGCRVRRTGYLERYPWDFTIRSERDSGASTELEKIVESGAGVTAGLGRLIKIFKGSINGIQSWAAAVSAWAQGASAARPTRSES